MKTPVVNTKSFLGSPDHCLLFIHVCVPRVVQKSASINLSRGLYMIKPALRKTMVSIIQRTSKYVTVMLNTDEEHIMNLVYKPTAGRKS